MSQGLFGFTSIHSDAHRGRRVQILFAWIHSGAPRIRRVHSGSRGLILVHLVVVGVRVGSLGRAKRSPGSFGFALGHLGTHTSLRVQSGSCSGPSGSLFHSVWPRLTEARLGDARLILVRLGSHWRTYWSPGSFGLARVHSCVTTGRRVHSGSRGFNPARIGVSVFILIGVRPIGYA